MTITMAKFIVKAVEYRANAFAKLAMNEKRKKRPIGGNYWTNCVEKCEIIGRLQNPNEKKNVKPIRMASIFGENTQLRLT